VAETPLLLAQGVGKRFGGLNALDGVSLAVASSEIHGLIGPNGAGKTTLVNLLSGLLAPSAGSIRFQGEEVAGRPAHVLARRGIRRTFQTLRIFPEMTVIGNVAVGYHIHTRAEVFDALLRTPRARREEAEVRARAQEAVDFAGLDVDPHMPAGALAYGQQRLLEIARAIVADPRLLLLDEPAAGMNPSECEHLLCLIRRLRQRGMALLIIEHRMDLIMEACHRITVLNYGRSLAEGTPEEIQANPAVIEAYLGKSNRAGA